MKVLEGAWMRSMCLTRQRVFRVSSLLCHRTNLDRLPSLDHLPYHHKVLLLIYLNLFHQILNPLFLLWSPSLISHGIIVNFEGAGVVLKKDSNVDALRWPLISSLPPIPIKHNRLSKTNIHLSSGTASPSGSQLRWKRPWHSRDLQQQHELYRATAKL